ncbi:MAG: efflux RND transporter permease subunit [Balneolales bacterium]
MHIFHRRYLISLFYMMVMIVGLLVWVRLPVEMAPDLQLPSVTVSHSWGRTSPEVMEKDVTRNVEQIARQLRDVENINSITREGQSTVTIQFQKDTPVDFRVVELQEHLHGLREAMPASLSPARVNRQVPRELEDMQTFLVYSISGEMNKYDLLELTRSRIQTPLLGLEGLSDVELHGASDPALTFDFDSDLVEQLGLSIPSIMGRIRGNLDWRSAGYRDEAGARMSMIVPPNLNNLDEIRSMPISLNDSDRRILLSDIADVEILDYPVKQIQRINGSPALTIHFIKEGGSDAMGLAEIINRRLDEIQGELPEGITLQLEQDSTKDLREQLTSLEYQALISLLCVFGVLILFIRKFRAPLVILGSIIFSMLASVIMLFMLDFTLNVITLAGLTISLGMIIDNAVVVFEQLNPQLPGQRESRFDHIKKELPHAIVPVLGSTLTTVGIFVPLLFALEEVRLFLLPLGLALTLTLVSSVLISLTWIPYALIWLVPSGKTKNTPSSPGVIARSMAAVKEALPRFSLNRFLLRVFHWRYRLRWLVYLAMILLIGIPLFLIPEPDSELEPDEESRWNKITSVYFDNRSDIDPWIGGLSYRFANETHFGERWIRSTSEIITVTIRTPLGTPIDEIDKIVQNFEQIGRPYQNAMHFYETELSELWGGRIQFHVKEDYYTQPEPYRLLGEASYLAARTGNSAISVSGFGDSFSSGFGGSNSSFSVSLSGYSYDELEVMARDLQRRLEQSPRVDNVNISQTSFYSRDNLFHYVLKPDDDRLFSKGLNRSDVIGSLQMGINPINTPYGQVEFQNQHMYLLARTQNKGGYREDFLNSKRLQQGVLFDVSEVATLNRERVMSEIRRENQSYTRVVTFDFLGPHRFGQDYTQGVIDAFPTPVGTSVTFGRSWFGFGGDDSYNLLLVFGLALLCVWMIVSALLEKWLDPLVVLLAVPLSAVGIMYGAMFHELSFDRNAMAGSLLAIGVVVNNAILLMHGKERMRKASIHGYRSWLYVYRNKMRTVLITSFTTLGGLIPLVLFDTSDFWQTLATVVCWGLASSTLFLVMLMGIWEGNHK